MPAIINISPTKQNKVAVTPAQKAIFPTAGESLAANKLSTSGRKFFEFWELMDAVKQHGYLSASMGIVGRSSVGAWWSLRKHKEFDNAPQRHRRKLYSFYMNQTKQWDNIKDYYNFAYKLIIAAKYLKFFGQAAFFIVRDQNGVPLGLDHLPGLVIPNTDSKGYFKKGEPAFVQYVSINPKDRVEFNDPRDIVYITNPDWEGSPLGGSDVEALAYYNLPIDFYLQTAAREYLKNRDRPEVIYSLPEDISEEAFDAFVQEVSDRWRGASNTGRSPITVQGEFKVTELRPLPSSLPYDGSRKQSRDEELAVAGVSGAKLGLVDGMTNSNFRELRREFHESTMIPIFRLIEIAFYEQIHVREFRAPGWEFKFNSPDFLTAVEKATVHMRYKQMSAMTSNEIRDDLNMQPRSDENGDMFDDQLEDDGTPGLPGFPPGTDEGPEDENDDGEDPEEAPERGDQHDDTTRAIKELRDWRDFIVKRIKRGRKVRSFHTESVPQWTRELVEEYIDSANSLKDIVGIFNVAISYLEGRE